MFGMVLATGIRILARINYSTNRYNLYIVAISLGVGLTPTLSTNTAISDGATAVAAQRDHARDV
jgi:xanthine/uracil permease